MVIRIAVLDPDPQERSTLESTLQRRGYVPVEHDLSADLMGRNLTMAFQFEVLAPLADANLIIMEKEFPDIDGITLIRLLKENKYTVHIPLLVLSHDRHYTAVLNCVQAGAGDYLVKPIDEDTLIRRVTLLLGQDQAGDPVQGVESVVMNFQDFLVRELKRSERSNLSLSIILGRIGTPEEIEHDPRLIRSSKDEQIDMRLNFFDQFLSGVRTSVRQYDTILRYGPQGLICVLPMTEKDGAYLVEERLMDLFQQDMSTDDILELRRLKLFTGVSAFPEEATSKHDLLSKAEFDLKTTQKTRKIRTLTTREGDRQVFLKELFCPVCKTRFQMEKPRDTAFKVVDLESDFQPVYQKGNPLFYAVPVCPRCYYASFFADFERLSETEIIKLKKGRMERGRTARHLDFLLPRNLESAVISYRLGAACYSQRQVDPSTMARLYHRAAWLLRDAGQRSDEKQMLEKALVYYERAFLKEDLKGKRLSDLEVTYLIGELSLRLGQPKRALEYLNTVLKASGTGRRQRLIQMARDRHKDAQYALKHHSRSFSLE